MKQTKGINTERWRKIRQTSGFRNSMLFLIFVFISTLFWFILAFNDNAQNSFNIDINITNKPDSVTFINEIPSKIHVNVRDKGTNLWRSSLRHPVLQFDFKDYAADGILRLTPSDINSGLKNIFGPSAQILSVSLDSIKLVYTTNKGKRIPVLVKSEVSPALGSIMEEMPVANPAFVEIYGEQEIIDTINYISTNLIELKNINETTILEASLNKIKGTRVIPSKVDVTFNIQPLVMKEALVTITPINVPENESLLLFPSKVPVKYFAAMTKLNVDEDNNINLTVDYKDIDHSKKGKLKISVESFPDRLKNLQLETDSVEYAILKQ